MEINIKRIIFYIIFFNPLVLLSQSISSVDSIYAKIKIRKITELSEKDLKKKYEITLYERENLNQEIDSFNCKIISDYNYDKLSVKAVPVFNLKKNYNLNKNIAHYIDFKSKCRNLLVYNIYYNDLFLTTNFVNRQNEKLFPIIFNCDLSMPIDSNMLTMMNLKLQDKYFVFQINNIRGVLFIVEKGEIFAITNPKINGEYEKFEINDFFRKNNLTYEKYISKKLGATEIIEQNTELQKQKYYLKIEQK
ncbi:MULTISPECIES: hypothetical protein [Flavobacterium]|uniref:GLPGLI family protein n=1 Tax=Flavobacterium hankyongi TaxID=1176532 RepID=A0ABP8ZS60_9FLAO|nr:hypothetical protein [Flavobacterium sp. N1846]